jgi:hypothetical protein
MTEKRSFFDPDYKELVIGIYKSKRIPLPVDPYQRKAYEELNAIKQILCEAAKEISRAALGGFVKERLVSISVYLETLKEIVKSTPEQIVEKAEGDQSYAAEMMAEKERIISLIHERYRN